MLPAAIRYSFTISNILRIQMKSLLVVICLFFSTFAVAQQTILNIPSADVMDKKQIYSRTDTSYFAGPDAATMAPNFIFGLGHNIEAGVNINAFGIPADFSNRAIVPNIKWKFLSTKAEAPLHFDMYAGDQLFVPTFHRSFDAGNYLYAAGALTIHKDTRFTFGGWDSANAVAIGNRGGGMLGLERTITHHKERNLVTLAADWQSGQGVHHARPALSRNDQSIDQHKNRLIKVDIKQRLRSREFEYLPRLIQPVESRLPQVKQPRLQCIRQLRSGCPTSRVFCKNWGFLRFWRLLTLARRGLLSTSRPLQRKEHLESRFRIERQNRVGNFIDRVFLHLAPAVSAISPSHARKQKPQVVVDLSRRSHRRPRIARRILLPDGNRGAIPSIVSASGFSIRSRNCRA